MGCLLFAPRAIALATLLTNRNAARDRYGYLTLALYFPFHSANLVYSETPLLSVNPDMEIIVRGGGFGGEGGREGEGERRACCLPRLQ